MFCGLFFSLYEGQCFVCFHSFPRTVAPNWGFSMYGFKCNCSLICSSLVCSPARNSKVFPEVLGHNQSLLSSAVSCWTEQGEPIAHCQRQGYCSRSTSSGGVQLSDPPATIPSHERQTLTLRRGELSTHSGAELPPGPGSLDSPSTCPSWVPPSQGPWGVALELCRPGPPLFTWAKHKAMYGPVTHSLKTRSCVSREGQTEQGIVWKYLGKSGSSLKKSVH